MTPDEQVCYEIGAAVMAAAAILFPWMARGRPKDTEAHYVAHVFVVLLAGVAYLALAMGQGAVVIDGRRVMLAHYAAWAFTAPTLLLTLALTAMEKRRDRRTRAR